MSKMLYLMRRGETLFNTLGRIQGFTDSPLTQKGIDQAQRAKAYFEKHDIIFDAVYSSTSERCCDTTEIIIGTTNYTRSKGIKEMNFGLFDGNPEYLNPKEPAGYETFFLDYGGESAEQVRDRMEETCREFMQPTTNKNVLAVSSNGACFYFLNLWADSKKIGIKKFSNCCLFKYSYHEGGNFNLIDIIDVIEDKSLLK